MKRKIKNSLQTRAEFARDCKVSRAAITKALAVENIHSHDGVHLDPDNEINKYFRIKSIAKAPLKEERKIRKTRDKEALERTGRFSADSKFIIMLEKLNGAKPKTQIEKIKNEVSFEIISLFSAFDWWTNGNFSQDWLIKKCHLWSNSINDRIDKSGID